MKKALLILLALSCLILPVRAEGFYDLPADHWAAEAIQQAVEAGAVNGYSDGSFQPGRDVTAAQFCAILSRSFLSKELAAAPEGKYQAMDACLPVLKGTSVEAAYKARTKHWDRYVDEPLSRYDMAQIICGLLSEKDRLIDDASAGTVREEITDWDEIPENYRTAVSACWASGVLQGQSGGRFAGTDSLNRAQACMVWSRLDALLNDRPDLPEEEEAPAKEMPAFGLQGEETVQEMMNRVNRGTPRCEEGCLPNGKARTEENIQELLELVREGCPDGTVWSGTMRYDYRPPRFNIAHGCVSFGLAVSDFVFGEEAPITQHQDFRSLSVGDMILIRGGGVERVLILTGVDREEDNYTACELELNGKVKWDAWGPISGLVDAFGFTTVYSRW